jgi:hypothetical protein
MNARPMPTPFQFVCIAAGAVAGSLIGFVLLDGGMIGGGIMGLCIFVGAIPYKKAVDAAKG